MSIGALLRGVEKRLRSAEVLDDRPGQADGAVCGICLAPGRPAPGFGDVWYAVHWAGAEGRDMDPQGHDAAHAVTVTITARLAKLPQDRRGRVAAAAGQLFDLADAIAAPNIVHGNYDVLRFANEFIGNGVSGFIEPLVLLGFGPETERDGSWIGSKDATNVFSIPVRFGKAGRVQLYEG